MENSIKKTDKIYSTYWWEMELDPNHPHNSSKVKLMTGYSKYEGHDEAMDKLELFMKKIIMLHSNGYFDKSKFIIFFMRVGNLLDKSNCRTLLWMNKEDYKINDEIKFDTKFYKYFFIEGGVLDFLNRFYDYTKNNKDVKFLVPSKKVKFSKDDYLDVTKQNFVSRRHLYAYGEKMIKNGHPYDAVMNFQIKYEQNKPFTN